MTVENDDEIGKLVKRACSTVAHAELSQEAVPVAIDALREVNVCCITGVPNSSANPPLPQAIDTGLWKVRVVALQMLQVSSFCLMSNNFHFHVSCICFHVCYLY